MQGLSRPMNQALYMESTFGEMVTASEDSKEGPRAFAEKRNFKGK